MEGGEEVGGGLEVSGCDPPEVLEAVEELLDPVAPAVKGCGLRSGPRGGCSGWRCGLLRRTPRWLRRPPGRSSRGRRRRRRSAPERADQFWRGGLVGGLPRGEQEPDREAPPVHDGVDLGRQPHGRDRWRDPRPLFPLTACWRARTMDLSIRCRDCGDFSASASKIRSQTPALTHLL